MNPEWRSPLYWARFRRARRALLARAPAGDGHAVLVLPGFLASDASTAPLRGFLNRLGYRSEGWGLGRNLGPRPDSRRRLADWLQAAVHRSGSAVTLVGWSLGGIYAREMARAAPAAVRRVITLGSPFRGGNEQRSVSRLYGWINPRGDAPRGEGVRLAEPLPVPVTAIYSRNDGVVDWRSCRLDEGECVPPNANHEVTAPHCALGVDPRTLAVIAESLAADAATVAA